MRLAPRLVAATAIAAAAVAVVPAGASERPGHTDRVSVATDGTQSNGDTVLDGVSMTPDARYVAFASSATNLVPGDTNGIPDVFVHDRLTGRTTVVSVATDGSRADAVPVLCTTGAHAPAISATGRYVAFVSCSPNLVPGDTNHNDDIFVHDMRSGVTTRISVNGAGAEANNRSESPSISADGRAVAFASLASNLDPRDCPTDAEQQVLCGSAAGGILYSREQVYVRDVVRRTTKLASVSSGGDVADGTNARPVISPDGRYVAFTSTADNLSSKDRNIHCASELVGDAPTCDDVYLHDRVTGKTELVSLGLSGDSAFGNSDTVASTSAVSAGGRYVAFRSSADDLVPAGGQVGIYVRDRATGRTRRVTVTSTGGRLGMGEGSYALSRTGTYVAFDDAETMSTCSPQPVQVARYDVTTGALEVEDRTDAAGHTNGCADYYSSSEPAISADGRWVAFASVAGDLVEHDSNGKIDVFVRDRGPTLGTGGLARSGALTISNAPGFAGTDVAGGSDAVSDVAAALTAQGANLIGATVAYRPRYGDLFFRLPVERMPPFALANPAVVYGLDLNARGVRYEVRAARTSPLTASFGLFRRDSGTWTQVATLHGGYGTTGQEVVVALPLRDVGASRGGRISRVQAFTGLGTFDVGATTVVDHVDIGGTR